MSKTSVYKNSNDQYQTTIPKSLVEAMDIEKGDKLDWKVSSGNRLQVEPVDE